MVVSSSSELTDAEFDKFVSYLASLPADAVPQERSDSFFPEFVKQELHVNVMEMYESHTNLLAEIWNPRDDKTTTTMLTGKFDSYAWEEAFIRPLAADKALSLARKICDSTS